MKYEFLTGSYAGRDEKGICRVGFDPGTGFQVMASVAGCVNPSFVLAHPNGRVFYAVEEAEEGRVRAGSLEGSLALEEQSFATLGASPCHLALSEDARYLYAANYSGGSLAAFALNDSGNIIRRTDLRQHTGSGPNPQRQEAAHVHFSTALDGLIFVCDLGIDAIVTYQNSDGLLHEMGRIAMPAGSGPRHLAHSAKHPGWLYCVSELNGRVYALKRSETGCVVDHSVSILPANFDGPQHRRCHPHHRRRRPAAGLQPGARQHRRGAAGRGRRPGRAGALALRGRAPGLPHLRGVRPRRQPAGFRYPRLSPEL